MLICFVLAFGAAGGYVGGSHELISALRKKSSGALYGESTAPPVLAQLISSMAIILGDRIEVGSTAAITSQITARDPKVKGDLNLVSMKKLRRKVQSLFSAYGAQYKSSYCLTATTIL